MSSNGIAFFFALGVLALFSATEQVLPFGPLILVLAYCFRIGGPGISTFRRATIVALPLAAWLALVWVVIVNRTPDRTLLYSPGAATTPEMAVAAVSSRLFVLALLTFSVVRDGGQIRPHFLTELTFPKNGKVILLAASSLADILRQGAVRAHTALVTANLLSGRWSLKNLKNGWLLLRTTWVAGVGIATERLDTKWTLEDLPGSAPLQRTSSRSFSLSDLLWTVAALLIIALERTHAWGFL